jgi:hypothetical protein
MESDHFVSSLLSEHNQQSYSEFILLLVFKYLLNDLLHGAESFLRS